MKLRQTPYRPPRETSPFPSPAAEGAKRWARQLAPILLILFGIDGVLTWIQHHQPNTPIARVATSLDQTEADASGDDPSQHAPMASELVDNRITRLAYPNEPKPETVWGRLDPTHETAFVTFSDKTVVRCKINNPPLRVGPNSLGFFIEDSQSLGVVEDATTEVKFSIDQPPSQFSSAPVSFAPGDPPGTYTARCSVSGDPGSFIVEIRRTGSVYVQVLTARFYFHPHP